MQLDAVWLLVGYVIGAVLGVIVCKIIERIWF